MFMTELSVLHLVPSRGAPFFENQIRILEQLGVNCRVIDVSRFHASNETFVESAGRPQNHSVIDYLRFLKPVLRNTIRSFDIVQTNHGLTAPFHLIYPHVPTVTSLWGGEANGKYGWIVRQCVRSSDANVVMSNRMRKQLRRDSYVIPHGVDINVFKPLNQSESQRQLDWNRNAAHVLFPYAPERTEKNYSLAKRVVQEAREKLDRPVILQVVYDVPHDEIPTYMNASDVLLLTSTREGSPNSVKEALACNLPIVSTDVGDVAERLEGVSPSRVATDKSSIVDALVEVIHADDRSNGRDVVDEVSLESMGKQMLDIYEELLDT